MSNRFFATDGTSELHPVARAWLDRIQRGQKATLNLWRKRDGLFFKPARMYLTFDTPNGPEPQPPQEWDMDINEALVKAGVRAEDATNESERLALMLRQWFAEPEETFGPGFFESVLVELLRREDFADGDALQKILNQVYVIPASRDGMSYPGCQKMLEGILKRAARCLLDDLKYGQTKAEAILAAALAKYIDERFHVYERKLLGWR